MLFVADGADSLGRRLRQEIESLGLTVSWRPAEATSLPSLDTELQRNGVVATIRVTAAAGGAVEIALVDKTDPTSVLHRHVGKNPGKASSAELLATQTVEILRANLITVPAQPAETAPAAPESPLLRLPPRANAPARPRERRGPDLALLAGPAVLGSDAFTPSAHVLGGITYLSSLHIGASVVALFPVVPARLSEPEGSVDLFASLYRVTALYQLEPWTSSLFVRFSAGIAITRLHWSGTANAPDLSAVDDGWTWSPTGGVAAGFRLTPSVRAVGELTLLVGYPRTVVRLAGREVTAWGRPAGVAAIGLELSLPFFASPPVDAASTAASVAR